MAYEEIAMSGDRRKEIVRNLSDEDLDRLLSEADDPKVVRRLTFVKNLYAGEFSPGQPLIALIMNILTEGQPMSAA